MELGGILDQLKDRTIFITGSTGFLGKIFVEKVLRVQPQVAKLFLLTRGTEAETAMQRVQREIIRTELFNILREKYGEEFHSFISEKVHPIDGDITCENLGIEDSYLREALWEKIDIVVNVAAVTNFFERYDVALGTNVLGAKNVMEFARKCPKIEILLHVSTAYVAGMQKGIVLEKLLHLGETLKQDTALDIEAEFKLVEEQKQKLQYSTKSMDTERRAMQALGLQRARNFGWPNTYVFTKAMGEMVLGHSRGNLPLVILRPTIVTSIYKEPLPGWIEGTRTIDMFIEAYAKGKLACVFGDFSQILDVIPGDLVVNAMIVAAISHIKQQSSFVYHICSSGRNPMTPYTLLQCGYHYFGKNPRKGKDGKAIKPMRVCVINSRALLRGYMTLRYRLPKLVLRWANAICFQSLSRQYQEVDREHKIYARLIDLYEPYLFFEGRFDDTNMERLRLAIEKDNDEAMMFNFDPKWIDWNEYFINIHIPCIIRSLYKQDQAK